MIIPPGVNIPMPRPYGGNPPVITRAAKQGEGEHGEVITVQLVGEIGPITQFLELLHVLDEAKESDEVVIVIDTPGGDVYTTMNIVEGMENCKAKVITVASGLVASAGTFLWFYGQERRVNRWARFLFHCSSHGDFGRSLQIQETATKLVKYMKELGLQMLGAGIINHAEYVAAFENKADVELSGATIRARLAKTFRAEAGEGEPDPAEGEGEAEGGEGEGTLENPPTEGEGAEPSMKRRKFKKFKKRRGEAGETPAAEPGEGEGEGEGAPAEGEGEEGGEAAPEFNPEAILAENGIEVPAEGEGEGEAGPAEGEGEGDSEGEGAEDTPAEGAPAAKCGKGKKGKKRRCEAGEAPVEGEPAEGEGEGEGETDAGEGEEAPAFDPAAILAENGIEMPAEGEGEAATSDDGEGEETGAEGGEGEAAEATPEAKRRRRR